MAMNFLCALSGFRQFRFGNLDCWADLSHSSMKKFWLSEFYNDGKDFLKQATQHSLTNLRGRTRYVTVKDSRDCRLLTNSSWGFLTGAEVKLSGKRDSCQ